MNMNLNLTQLAIDMQAFINAIQSGKYDNNIISKDEATAIEAIIHSSDDIFRSSEYKLFDILIKHYNYEHEKSKSISRE